MLRLSGSVVLPYVKRPLPGLKFVPAGVCVVLMVCSIGCGPSGPERTPVSGNVSFNGAPVQDGQIRFLPSKETGGGPMSGAYIVAGKYNADRKGGVPVGVCRVEILAWRATANGSAGSGSVVAAPRGPQYIPPKFNANSELQITIEPGSGPVAKDFDLKP